MGISEIMKLYAIKQNGYQISQQKGKNKAVKALKKHLEWQGIDENNQEWFTAKSGNIHVKIDNSLYSIEESH